MTHRAALATIAAAASLDAACGLAFGAADHVGAWDGLYWAVVSGTTTGYGDITPRGWAAHVLAVVVMLTVIPLVSATFSLLTSGLTSGHVAAAEDRLKAHVEARLRHHLGGGDVGQEDT